MWKTSWQRKRFLSEILRLWKKRGLGIAVILGHLMHSNGGPFTTSFYLNGPKSRGRKQLNNKLQIRFSLSCQFYIQTPPLMLMMMILERNKSNVVDDEDPGREERAGQWMFMGNVGVVDNWKAIFTPIAFLSHSFSFVLPFKNKKKVQNHLFSKTGIKEENESDPQIKVIIPISLQSGKLKLGRKDSLLAKVTGYPVCMNLFVLWFIHTLYTTSAYKSLGTMHSLQIKCTCDLFGHPLIHYNSVQAP